MTPNLSHLHLLLNHFPTTGMVIAVGLFLLAITKNSEDLRRASFAVFFAIALLSLPAYMTGYAALDSVDNRPAIDLEAIHRHQSSALLALVFIEVTGVVAWFALWRSRRSPASPRVSAAVLLLSIVTLALMASTANVGGEILHDEIRVEGAPAGAIAPEWLRSQSVTDLFTNYRWAWPILEGLHFIGLALLFGVVLTAYLRVAGFLRQMPVDSVHRLLPWGITALVIQTVTGMAFYVGQSLQYVYNLSFHLKMLCILTAGAGLLYLTYSHAVWDDLPEKKTPSTFKVIFALQVILWIAVIYFGRMLPYIGMAY